jgi:anti-sigma regulatory factor (Ser/Thr protein kinase)
VSEPEDTVSELEGIASELEDVVPALAESGRGLQIVEALCDQLRWRRTAAGKTVWFVLSTGSDGALPLAA